MKRLLTIFSFLLPFLMMHAETKLYFDEFKIKPGETKPLELKLKNESRVKGLEVKIRLPQGLSFVEDSEEEEYAVGTSRCSFLSSSIKADGSLGIAGVATKTKDYIKVDDGAIATLLIKAATDAPLAVASIEIYDMEIVMEESTINPLATSFSANIYKVCTVTVSSSNPEMGTVQGGGDYESGTKITLTATPTAEGYRFVKWSDETTINPYEYTVTGDATIAATFAPNKYKVTFISDGVTVKESEIEYSADIVTPDSPTKTGYTFKGWDPAVPDKMPAGELTFTAQWEINKYTMTFVLGNGQDNIVKEQNYGTELTAPVDLEREGYTFKGWDVEVPATVPAENKTFTAQWQVNKYKVTFIVDGMTVKDGEVEYGTAIEKPTDPVKENYTFIGWEPAVPATMPAQDMTFTALFAKTPYTMTFVLGNGEADIVKTQEVGSALQAPADPEREGYTFLGWSPEVPATVPAENKTFTAQWQVNQYTATFVLGTGATDVVKTQDYGTELTAPTDLTREGYTFKCWEPVVPNKMPAESKTYTAQWEVNKYKVTFIVDDMTVKEGEVEYGATIEKPVDPIKENYTFTGWSPEVPTSMPAQDLTFTAQFTKNSYTMTFVLGNGEPDIVKTLEVGSTFEAPDNPTREGYTFLGWSPEIPVTVPAENKTFTAQWKINQYSVIYILNDQEWARDTYDYGAAITLREYIPTDDEIFSGWMFKDGETYTTMPAHDVTVVGSVTTAILEIFKGQDTVNVYDLRGRLIRRNVPISELRKVLRSGVYIIGGHKMYLK